MYYLLGAAAVVASVGVYVWTRMRPAEDLYEEATVMRIRQLNREGYRD